MILVDSNVVIYAFDRGAGWKHDRAYDLLVEIEASSEGFLSTQVLNEFYWNVTRKIEIRLSEREAAEVVRYLTESWIVLPVTESVVLEGIRGAQEHQLHFWDGLIWAVAKLNGIELIATEDFSHDQQVEGVRYFNPFVNR